MRFSKVHFGLISILIIKHSKSSDKKGINNKKVKNIRN